MWHTIDLTKPAHVTGVIAELPGIEPHSGTGLEFTGNFAMRCPAVHKVYREKTDVQAIVAASRIYWGEGTDLKKFQDATTDARARIDLRNKFSMASSPSHPLLDLSLDRLKNISREGYIRIGGKPVLIEDLARGSIINPYLVFDLDRPLGPHAAGPVEVAESLAHLADAIRGGPAPVQLFFSWINWQDDQLEGICEAIVRNWRGRPPETRVQGVGMSGLSAHQLTTAKGIFRGTGVLFNRVAA